MKRAQICVFMVMRRGGCAPPPSLTCCWTCWSLSRCMQPTDSLAFCQVLTYESALYASGEGRHEDAVGLLYEMLEHPLLAPGKGD